MYARAKNKNCQQPPATVGVCWPWYKHWSHFLVQWEGVVSGSCSPSLGTSQYNFPQLWLSFERVAPEHNLPKGRDATERWQMCYKRAIYILHKCVTQESNLHSVFIWHPTESGSNTRLVLNMETQVSSLGPLVLAHQSCSKLDRASPS